MTTDTGTTGRDVTAEQITAIAQEVWESLLGLSLLPHPLGADAPALQGESMTGCVHVSGEWNGSVFLQCGVEVAAVLAEAMFADDPGTLSDDEVGDALATRIAELAAAVGAPRRLRDVGVSPSDLSGLARSTLCDACLTTNPRDVDEADVVALLQAAL